MKSRIVELWSGDNCGASYLNENFKDHLEERLKHETYLFHNGVTKESIVRELIPKFEEDYKRRVDINSRCPTHGIYIAGLRADEDQDPRSKETRRKFFDRNQLLMRKYIFQSPSKFNSSLAFQLLTRDENPDRITKSFSKTF